MNEIKPWTCDNATGALYHNQHKIGTLIYGINGVEGEQLLKQANAHEPLSEVVRIARLFVVPCTASEVCRREDMLREALAKLPIP